MRKYVNFVIYNPDTKLLYNKEKVLELNHFLYKVLEKYKIPNYLTNIKVIVHKNMQEVDNGIVYIGIDKNNKEQYIYGKEYVKSRNNKRTEIFLNVESKIKKIEKFINQTLKNIKNKNEITDDVLFSIILLLETTFYIRTGKKKYFDENKTIGILTLQNKHLILKDDEIILEFIGKVKQKNIFIISKYNHPLLFSVLKLLKNFTKNDDDLIFTNFKNIPFSEKKLYNRINKFNIRFKDIRTFGVNNILIKELWKEIQNIDNTFSVKEILKKIINNTAKIIGHTPSISKSSYMIEYLINYIIKDKNLLLNSKDMDFNYFYNFIISKLKNIYKYK